MPCVSGDLSPLISRLRDKLLAVFFPPKGKPSVRCANMANMALHCGLPLRFALIRRLRDKLLAVFSPPRGKPLHPLHFSQQDGRVEIRKLGCFCNSACFLIFCLLPEIVFTMFARAYKRLPLGGKLSR